MSIRARFGMMVKYVQMRMLVIRAMRMLAVYMVRSMHMGALVVRVPGMRI